MGLVDIALTNWFLVRFGVSPEAVELFLRFVQTGTFGARINVFTDDNPEHKELGKQLSAHNEFRNALAHGMVFPAADPDSSFPEIGKDWDLQVFKRKGNKRVRVTAAEIEAKRTEVVELASHLLRLTKNLMRESPSVSAPEHDAGAGG
jgi:hypothetical protein